MTALYNVLERVRELENGYDVPPLTAKEKDIHEAGLVSVLKDIHDDIDRAVFEAYVWADLIPALVGKPGATMPSPHKTPEQEEAEEELLTRLVALNQERAAEERRGIVRWLRPDYQIPKLGHKVKTPEDVEQVEAQLVVPAPADGRPAWPKDEMDRISIVRRHAEPRSRPGGAANPGRRLQRKEFSPAHKGSGEGSADPRRRRRCPARDRRAGRRQSVLHSALVQIWFCNGIHVEADTRLTSNPHDQPCLQMSFARLSGGFPDPEVEVRSHPGSLHLEPFTEWCTDAPIRKAGLATFGSITDLSF